MPYKSDAQRKYFNANRKELESQGVDVDEWNDSSRGKKLPEKVKEKEASDALNMLHRQAAQLLVSVKQAAEDEDKPKKKDSPSKKIVDMNSVGGALADYLAPVHWGGERAGRTQAMADAIGEKTTFGVRHPYMQTVGHSLVGGGLGGLLGTGAGIGLNYLTGRASGEAPTTLGGAGALLGAIAGKLNAGRVRRNEMKRIGHFYDEDSAAGKVNSKDPKLSALSAFLLPLRGPHRTGQVEAVKAMRGERTIPEQRGARSALYTLGNLPYVGPPASLLHGYGQNIKTQLASPTESKPQTFERRSKMEEKEAFSISDVALLAREAVKQARCWKGYEPVPGKAPYSEDSCRPAGSGKKKKSKVKQANIDQHIKQAFLAWGGGSLGLHPKGRGIGGELGYTNLLGTLPIPLAGIDIGGPRKGFSMGVTPSVNSDYGISPYIGLRWNHPRKSGITRNFPRGLPEVLYDRLRGRTKLDAMRASYPELFENDESEATNEAKPEAEKKEKFERKPKEEKKANAIAQLAMNAVPSLVLGSAFGGLKGLAENPGVNPETGKDKSRLMNVLTGMLSGAASGGLGSLKAGAEACSCGCGKPDGECGFDDNSPIQKMARLAVKQAEGAWTREEGQSDSGGLNAKGRASLKAQGHNIKPPVTESNPKGERAGRKASFCARMGGMKSKLTSKETANDPDSRINKSLRKWNC